MSAELKIMTHALQAMDRILGTKPVVRVESNPLDRCDVCGAEDKHDQFVHDFQSGREIALCHECSR
jgi:hypothetical protein